MPKTLAYIAAGLLLLAVLPMPYGYYQFLRLVVTGVFIWYAYIAFDAGRKNFAVICGLIALLFNPLIKIALDREVWMVINILTGAFLLYLVRTMTPPTEKLN